MSPFSDPDGSDRDGPPVAGSTRTPPLAEDSSSAKSPVLAVPGRLSGSRIFLFGKLAGMPRREVKQIIRQQGGVAVEPRAAERSVQGSAEMARSVENARDEERKEAFAGSEREEEVTMVVVGDDLSEWRPLLRKQFSAIAWGVDTGRIELLQESEFWHRVGLLDPQDGVHRLYTPAMLAELLGVSVSAIRHWHRRKTLVACRHVRRLPYFDFAEVSVARHLVDLHKAGCSLPAIDRKLRELATMMPGCDRPLAEVGVVVEGQRLFIRRGEDLEEPSGQRQFDFDRLARGERGATADWKESIPLASGDNSDEAVPLAIGPESSDCDQGLTTMDRLLQDAIQYEDQGNLELAAETYRSILMASGPSAEMNFALADVLYRQGDHAAARERYYMAIEMDEEYVESRANLGCLLAEMGELEMAIAAFQGALAYHADYADAHYHMAGALDQMGRHREAESHWLAFLALAPESAWAEVARMRLAAGWNTPEDGPPAGSRE